MKSPRLREVSRVSVQPRDRIFYFYFCFSFSFSFYRYAVRSHLLRERAPEKSLPFRFLCVTFNRSESTRFTHFYLVPRISSWIIFLEPSFVICASSLVQYALSLHAVLCHSLVHIKRNTNANVPVTSAYARFRYYLLRPFAFRGDAWWVGWFPSFHDTIREMIMDFGSGRLFLYLDEATW